MSDLENSTATTFSHPNNEKSPLKKTNPPHQSLIKGDILTSLSPYLNFIALRIPDFQNPNPLKSNT